MLCRHAHPWCRAKNVLYEHRWVLFSFLVIDNKDSFVVPSWVLVVIGLLSCFRQWELSGLIHPFQPIFEKVQQFSASCPHDRWYLQQLVRSKFLDCQGASASSIILGRSIFPLGNNRSKAWLQVVLMGAYSVKRFIACTSLGLLAFYPCFNSCFSSYYQS